MNKAGVSLHYVELREEARKSWEHGVSNEIVYVPDSVEVLGEPGSAPSEIYLKEKSWVHIQFALLNDRNAHYEAIVERLQGLSDVFTGVREVNLGLAPVGGNSPVLVEVTHDIQPPKRMRFVGCPSMIWLKRSNLIDGFNGSDASSLLRKPIPALAVVKFKDGELRSLESKGLSGPVCQAPNELVQTGTHVIESVPNCKGNGIGNIQQLNPQDVPLIFKIILTRKSAGFRLVQPVIKGCNQHLQSIKMFLRPTQFQVGVYHASHDS